MRRALLAALLAVALTLLAGSTSVAAKEKNDRATGTFTANGCLLTDSVSWRSLPPVFRIDTTLLQDGHPYVVATSIIRDPRLGQRALTSPQLVETFGMSDVIFTHGYAVEFVLSDRHGRVLARTASPTVTVFCDFA
jgi:hypothetical protein